MVMTRKQPLILHCSYKAHLWQHERLKKLQQQTAQLPADTTTKPTPVIQTNTAPTLTQCIQKSKL